MLCCRGGFPSLPRFTAQSVPVIPACSGFAVFAYVAVLSRSLQIATFVGCSCCGWVTTVCFFFLGWFCGTLWQGVVFRAEFPACCCFVQPAPIISENSGFVVFVGLCVGYFRLCR